MQEILIWKLHSYIKENNPELLQQLQQDSSITNWLTQKVDGIAETLNAMLEQNKPVYTIEEECMILLTGDLQPSRFHFIRNILEEEFPAHFEPVLTEGILEEMIIGLVAICESAFEQVSFSKERADDPLLRYTLIGLLEEHLNKAE